MRAWLTRPLTSLPGFRDRAEFSSTVSGKASLEIYNVLGQKVGIVYEGVVKAGEVYDVKFNVRGSKTTALMYRLNVNDKSASGKLFKE